MAAARCVYRTVPCRVRALAESSLADTMEDPVSRRSAVSLLIVLSHAALTQLVAARVARAQQPGEVSYHDESVLPEGVIGERIVSMIETFNSGDPDRVRAYLESECTARFRNFAPIEDHLEVFASVLRQWGPVEFHSVRTYTPPRPDETIVILKDRNFGAWRAFSFQFDESADYRVSGFGFNDARTPTNVEAPPALRGGRVAQVGERISAEALAGSDQAVQHGRHRGDRETPQKV